MLERTSTVQTIAWITDLQHGKQLDFDPPYQRLSVWNENYRKYFIDTVIRNYPSPAVFLYVEISNLGRTMYHIVDGKQRLLAIIDFVQDVFPTSTTYSDPEIAGLYFSELPERRRNDFFRYLLPVEILDSSNSTELIEAFDRLNRNTAQLNAQELRNARYDGAFIALMRTLADHPFWEQVGLSTRTRVRRMLDIEYVSEIFLLTMEGVQEGKKALDRAYAEYDEEIPNVEVHRRSYETCQSIIEDMWPSLANTRFKNVADFYSLWAACLQTIKDGNSVDTEASGAKLNAFAEPYSIS